MSLYAQFYSTIWNRLPDQNWILEKTKNPAVGRLVDLGCATGRVMKIAETQGWSAWGIDNDKAMASEFQKLHGQNPNLHLVRGDIRNFRDIGEFDIVTCMANTFSLLTDPQARLGLVESSAAAMRPGGSLMIWVLSDSTDMDGTKSVEFETPFGVLVYESNVRTEKSDSTRAINFTFKLNGLIEEHHLMTSLISNSEMLENFELNGLAINRAWGNFDGSPIGRGQPFQIYEARKNS